MPHLPLVPSPASSDSPSSDAGILSEELFLSAIVQEVTRVMLTAENLHRTLHTFLLGIGEIAGMRPMALFRLEQDHLLLETHVGAGLRKKLNGFCPELRFRNLAECLSSAEQVFEEKPEADDPFKALGKGSYVLIPLVVGNSAPGLENARRCVAVLWLDTGPETPPLTGQGLSYLLGLARLAALRIENFGIHRELQKANQGLQKANGKLELANQRLHAAQKRIEEDLNRGRAIQDSLLPQNLPRDRFRDLVSRYIPAGKVGGDYWDCFEISGAKLGLIVADVSGHGISAALVMTMFKVLLKTFAPLTDSPAEVLQKINNTFLNEITGGRHFVTAFYGVYDLQSRRLTWTNAGHIAQFALLPPTPTGMATALGESHGMESWDLAKPLAELSSVGLVLGVFEQTLITDRIIDLPLGSRLILYTDGITEAHDAKGEMFGNGRMRELALMMRDRRAEELAAIIMQTWRKHQGGIIKTHGSDESADDATLVILDL